jgi:hypothetical protein
MAEQSAELRTALRPWHERAMNIIWNRIEDAWTHAAAGQIPTAGRRLTELLGSLAQHVSDGKASFYRQAFQQHTRAGLDPDVHQLGLGPDHHGEQAARQTAILGWKHTDELLDVISDAQASLTLAALAEQSGGGPFLQSWADQQRDRLAGLTARQLSDAQIAIFEAVGQILVKPELR